LLAGAARLPGVKLIRHDAPALDEGAVAAGLAEGPGPGVSAFNLVRSLGRGLSMLEIFPWGQAVLQIVLLVAATLFLRHRLGDARAEARAAKDHDAHYAWAVSTPTPKLQEEKKELEQKAEALRNFLETRVLWTAHARDMAGRLGPAIALTSFQGAAELEGGKGKARRSLALKLSAPLKKAGAMPKEIDAFLRTLRDDPLLKRDFPEIELGDLRWAPGTNGQSTATFNVTCQPKAKPAPAKAQPAAKPAKS
jgi:hypothetical protein